MAKINFIVDPGQVKTIQFIPDNDVNSSNTVSQKKQSPWYQKLGASLASSLNQPHPDAPVVVGVKDALRNMGVDVANLIPGVNLPQYKSASGGAYQTGKVLGNILGFAGGGEGLEALRGAAKGVPFIGKAAKALEGSLPREIIKRAIGTSAYGALTHPDDRIRGAVEGGSTSVLSDIVPIGLLQSGKEILKSIAKGAQNPLEEAAAIHQTSNAPLSVFDIAGHQAGQRALNTVIGKIPFSGIRENLKRSVNEVNNRTGALMNYFRGNYDPAEIDDSIADRILSNFDNKKAQDGQNYTNLSEAADSAGVKIGDRDNLKDVANKYLNDHVEALKTGNESALDKDALSSLKNITKEEPFLPSRLSTSINTRSIYGEKAAQNYSRGNNYLGKLYTDLKGGLDKDISKAIVQSDNKEIQDTWKNINDFHKNEIIPYTKNGFVTRLKNNNIKTESLPTLLLSGNNAKILNDLNDTERKALAYSVFHKASQEGTENELHWTPSKIIKKYDSLSPKQKENLLNPSERGEINNIRRLVKANIENNLALNNPATGFALKGDRVFPTIAGLSGLSILHPLYGVAAATALGAGRALTKLARSNRLKEAYLNQNKKINYRRGIPAKVLLGGSLPFLP